MNKLFGGILVLLSFASCLKSQTADSLTHDAVRLISFRELPDSIVYSNQVIGFSLKSESDSTLYYSISLEEKTGDEWVAIINDLFRHQYDRYGARNMRILLPFEERAYMWGLNDIFPYGCIPLGLCRFKCLIKDSPFDEGESIYSEPFLLPLATD